MILKYISEKCNICKQISINIDSVTKSVGGSYICYNNCSIINSKLLIYSELYIIILYKICNIIGIKCNFIEPKCNNIV